AKNTLIDSAYLSFESKQIHAVALQHHSRTASKLEKGWRDYFVSRQRVWVTDYSERKKFSRSCSCWLLRLLKFCITCLASFPWLACALIAWIRSFVRPSCRKNIRCPKPHNGAVRNWSPPALPCETLSARPVPM